jgi:hypothetical protein
MVATLDGPAPFSLIVPGNVGFGAATAYLGPVGTAMPSDSVNLGVSWAVGIPAWVPVGATDTGVATTYTPQTNDLTIEESPIPAAVLVNSLDLSTSLAFAEDVIANIKFAFGTGSLVTTAAGAAGVIGKTVFTLGRALNNYALGIEMQLPTGHWRRIAIPNVVSVGTVQTNYNRASGKRMYPATFRTICLPEQISWTDKTAESTS